MEISELLSSVAELKDLPSNVRSSVLLDGVCDRFTVLVVELAQNDFDEKRDDSETQLPKLAQNKNRPMVLIQREYGELSTFSAVSLREVMKQNIPEILNICKMFVYCACYVDRLTAVRGNVRNVKGSCVIYNNC
uniref:Uncharacterized protein n=1 Tax=Glossina austeni TaxID=7395 RepID=A0A1A9VS17_GLOAU